ncbi:IPT/TIG domain-containing protein [Spirillospora sp. NBC_00431]
MAIAITGITPNTGPTTGGTVHYITGTDLNLVTNVTIGGTVCPLFEDLSGTLMKVTSPAGTAGAKDVVLSPGAVTLAGGFTYAATTGTEQLRSTLARKWKLDINTGTVESPVWTPVRAIGELKPNIESNMEDDSDYDSDGWASETKTQMKWSLETKVLRKVGVTSENYDPGQEALRAAADQFGSPGTPQVRWYDRDGGPEAYSGFASVSWEPEGGEAKDLDTVTIKMSGQGKRTTITNPAL